MDTIKIKNGITIKQFLLQFQEVYPHLLCLISSSGASQNEMLWSYQKKHELPRNTKYTHEEDDCYYFVDLEGKEYCLFGLAAAEAFSASSAADFRKPIVLLEAIGEKQDLIVIKFQNQTFEFVKPHKLLEFKTLNIFNVKNTPIEISK